MFPNSFMSTIMTMKADIYEQENTQDEKTGSIARHWEYKKTVRCHIEPSKSSGVATTGDGKKFSAGNDMYQEPLQLRAKFNNRLSKRWRISNIVASNGELIYKEFDLYSQPATVFEVVSCHPMTDPFGRLSHFDVTLERVNIQNNDSN